MKFIKTIWPYVITISLSISAYFICNRFFVNKIVEEEVAYSSDTVSVVEMAWGINYFKTPDKQYLPAGSRVEDGLVYSRMIPDLKGNFRLKLRLEEGTELNYLIVPCLHNHHQSL